MSRGDRRTYATLSDIASEATPTVYSPAGIWVAVRPQGAGPGDDHVKGHEVETDYNAQLTTATILTLDDGRKLYVKGLQNVNNRRDTYLLYCEEVLQT